MKANKTLLTVLIILFWGIAPAAFADIYINVMAVNATGDPKTSTIHFDLPGELTSDDILDTNGLQLDYNVEDADYFVYGDVTLQPKESKTFRIHVKDVWMINQDQVDDLQKQIDQGYETLGKPHDPQKADILRDRLEKKITYIMSLQSTNADSIDKRIDAYRQYIKEMKRIEDNALDVSYWRSDPGQDEQPKIVHLTINIENPTQQLKPSYKEKVYLPQEVRPEDVVEAEDFEVRYDPIKQLAFLFKEEDLSPGQKKQYSIGIVDIWNIPQKDINYLASRAKYAADFLQDTKFEDSAKLLLEHVTANLKTIQDSQAVQRPFVEHISAYRSNKDLYDETEKQVENLEKLLSVFREDLEKSKVENILQHIQSLRGINDVSKVMFNKKFESSTAWSFIGWVLLFVGILTFINFMVWLLRSKDKKMPQEAPAQEKSKQEAPK